MASAEIASFRDRFAHEFDRPAPTANSLLVLVTHAIASAEDHVVRRAGGKPVVRSRDAEFAAKGDASRLAGRADDVKRRIDETLAALDGRLGEERGKVGRGICCAREARRRPSGRRRP